MMVSRTAAFRCGRAGNPILFETLMPYPTEEFLRRRCRRIFLSNLTLSCSIGVYEAEHRRRQPVVISADVWVPLKSTPSERDALDDVFNYSRITETIRKTALSKHFNLQETLVDTLAERLSAMPGVVMARVSTAKTEVYPDAEAVGIEVWRPGLQYRDESSS